MKGSRLGEPPPSCDPPNPFAALTLILLRRWTFAFASPLLAAPLLVNAKARQSYRLGWLFLPPTSRLLTTRYLIISRLLFCRQEF